MSRLGWNWELGIWNWLRNLDAENPKAFSYANYLRYLADVKTLARIQVAVVVLIAVATLPALGQHLRESWQPVTHGGYDTWGTGIHIKSKVDTLENYEPMLDTSDTTLAIRPAEINSLESLVSLCRQQPGDLLRKLKNENWIEDTSYFEAPLEVRKFRYTANKACFLRVTFYKGAVNSIMYLSPYSTKEDEQLYKLSDTQLSGRFIKKTMRFNGLWTRTDYFSSFDRKVVCAIFFSLSEEKTTKIFYWIYRAKDI